MEEQILYRVEVLLLIAAGFIFAEIANCIYLTFT